MNINPVQERTRDFCPIFLNENWRTRAFL